MPEINKMAFRILAGVLVCMLFAGRVLSLTSIEDARYLLLADREIAASQHLLQDLTVESKVVQIGYLIA